MSCDSKKCKKCKECECTCKSKCAECEHMECHCNASDESSEASDEDVEV